ncbi:uncharacterized protein HBSAL_05870 [Halobacterium salinarum]|uniref:Uncharacterized protein n=1 Tax=Halobacterium salinarum (strain ATCC 33171 / DSM 3754 / JCM 8978 / NBRC 102687 / NCIMB 764 / 91-R6) TaxID=2597657 RepID=A0A4D6GSV8_HALS9|nr:uncharacterized protein HBSAL_05870 [Halobacterium salinarum]
MLIDEIVRGDRAEDDVRVRLLDDEHDADGPPPT